MLAVKFEGVKEHQVFSVQTAQACWASKQVWFQNASKKKKGEKKENIEPTAKAPALLVLQETGSLMW